MVASHVDPKSGGGDGASKGLVGLVSRTRWAQRASLMGLDGSAGSIDGLVSFFFFYYLLINRRVHMAAPVDPD